MGLVVLTVCNLLVSWSQSTVTLQHMPCRRMIRERVKLFSLAKYFVPIKPGEQE